jgi:LacI family transcriptional regulator
MLSLPEDSAFRKFDSGRTSRIDQEAIKKPSTRGAFAMSERFTVKQIAAQAGVSTATVDRVLNGRSGVHYQTQLRVARAIAELERRAAASLAIGWNLYVDVVMHSPVRFTRIVQQALDQAVAELDPFRISPRFHLFEDVTPGELARRLEALATDRPGGIILKAPDEPILAEAIAKVTAAGIPVVTLVTDIPRAPRLAYVGMDNRAAGRTAAFLLGRLLVGKTGTVLANIGGPHFQGEEEREIGFRGLMRERFPNLSVAEVSGGYGLDHETRARVSECLAEHRDVIAVYSMGGGNGGILEAFDRAKRPIHAFIGHDLDAENRRLLEAGRIDAIVDHDLVADARGALRAILGFHKRIKGEFRPRPSRAMVITPYNL